MPEGLIPDRIVVAQAVKNDVLLGDKAAATIPVVWDHPRMYTAHGAPMVFPGNLMDSPSVECVDYEQTVP